MGLEDVFGSIKSKTYASDAEREQAATSLTEKCGYAAAAVTLLPIPATEYFAVMPIHVGMVVAIGHIYGAEMNRDSATKLLLRIGASVGLSLMGSRIATTAAKILLPGLGGLLGAPFMYASTLAIGMVARIYFESQGQVSDDDMKSVYEQALKKAKRGFDPTKARSREAQDLASDAATKAKTDPVAKEAAAAAAAAPAEDAVSRLERLKAMRDKGLVDDAEFEAVKKRILSEL